jgi:hypothetical protein
MIGKEGKGFAFANTTNKFQITILKFQIISKFEKPIVETYQPVY